MRPSLLPPGRLRLPTMLAWAAAVACLLALAHRARFTADVSDEGFSIAMPYRFVLGDRPFVEEVSIQQLSGLVLFPFVWLYVKLTGGSTGLVLFTRFIGFAVFKGTCALSVFALARRWLRYVSSAIAVSLVVFTFVPYSIPNVGYNLIGFAFLAAGSFLAAAAIAEPDEKTRLKMLAWAGFIEGVMVVAYQPLAIATVLLVPMIFAFSPGSLAGRLKATGAFVTGGLIAALLFSSALVFGGVAGLRRSLGWGIHAQEAHGMVRFNGLLVNLWNGVPRFTTFAIIGVIAAFVVRARWLTAVVISGITLAIVLVYKDESQQFYAGNNTVIYGGAVAPLLLLLAKPDRNVWKGSAMILLPGYAGAVAASFVSTNGMNAAFTGMLAALVLFALLAARALERNGFEPVLCMLPALTFSFVLTTRFYDFVYRDAPLAQETETVKVGPYKGIRTTVDRAQSFEELLQITKRFDQDDGKILFLYESPAAYLFSKMRPSAECVWEVPFSSQESMLAQWQKYPKGHGLVVKIKGNAAGAVDPILIAPERKLLETKHFIVYRDG